MLVWHLLFTVKCPLPPNVDLNASQNLSMIRTNFWFWVIKTEPPPTHTGCCGNLLIRWPLGVSLQVCLGPARHPAPVSATPSYGREAPVAPFPAPADGLLPSALSEWRWRWQQCRNERIREKRWKMMRIKQDESTRGSLGWQEGKNIGMVERRERIRSAAVKYISWQLIYKKQHCLFHYINRKKVSEI